MSGNLPKTDPTDILRLRDGLYVVDLMAAALSGLDLFTWLSKRPSDKKTICESLQIQERPTDVMLTLFVALGYLRKTATDRSLTVAAQSRAGQQVASAEDEVFQVT